VAIASTPGLKKYLSKKRVQLYALAVVRKTNGAQHNLKRPTIHNFAEANRARSIVESPVALIKLEENIMNEPTTRIYISWEDSDNLGIVDVEGNKITIPRTILHSVANMLAERACLPSVWPVRLTVWERITGRYWGNLR